MASIVTQGMLSSLGRVPVRVTTVHWTRLPLTLALGLVAIMFATIATPRVVHAQCTGAYTTVTPCTQSKYVFANTTGSTATLTVKNIGRSPSDTYTVFCGHSGYVTGCSVSPASFTVALGDSQTVTVTFNTGPWTGATGAVFVYLSGLGTGDGFIPLVHVSSPDVTVDTGAFNATDQLHSLCANECFAGAATYSTVPFYTLNTPRNLTLVYTEDRVHPRPVVYADVTPAAGTPTPTQTTLSATLNGSAIHWLNGDTQLYFTGSSSKVRLAGQFDASSYTTGVYTLVITVTAIYSGGQVLSHSYTRYVAIANEAHSPIARGWTVAGQQRLYQSGGMYLITDGTGDAVVFTALGTTAVDYSTLTYDSPSSQYIRTSLMGTKSYFNTAGQLLKVVDRLGLTTTFTYSGTQLSTIADPEWTIRGGTGTHLSLSYGANGLTSISEVGGVAGRTTTVTVASDSTLQAITDPDGVATHFTYDASGRLSTMLDRRGDTTTYQYDTHSWKLAEVDLPRIAADAGGGSTVNVIPKIKDTAWIALGVPTAATSSGAPATPILRTSVFAKIVDPIGRVTMINPDGWGQPLSIIDPAGQTTTIYRGTGIMPLLVVNPTGGTDTIKYVSNTPLVSYLRLAGDSVVNFLYGAQNQVDSIWGPGRDAEYRALDATTGRVDAIRYASSTQLVATFSYDASNRLLSYQDPGTHITAYHYDATTGNVDSASGPGGRYTIARFDAHGRDSLTRTSGTPMVHTLYDTLNRVTTTWHEGVAHDSTRITYDALWPIRVQAPGSQVAKVELNALGWMTKQYSLRDTTVYRSYRYDTAGRVTSLTNRRSQRVDMTYDALDRLLTRTAGIGIPADTFGYSTNGLVQWSIRKNVSRDTLYMNLRGQPDSLIRKIAGHRYALLYTYKDSTNRTARTVSLTNDAGIAFSQETDATHDTIPTTDSLTLTGGPEAGTTFIYRNPDGNMTDLNWPYVTHHMFVFWTAMHQIYGSEPFNLGGFHETISDSVGRNYGYSPAGRVLLDNRTFRPGNHLGFYNRRMTYDTLGRLLLVRSALDSSCTGGDTLSAGALFTSCTKYGTAVTQDSVTYDSVGNRQFPGDSSGGDQLLKGPGGTRYTYDADGNLATRVHGTVTDSLFWSPLGLLDSVASTGGLRHMYEYNAYGQLVRRQTKPNGGSYAVDRYFVWDGTHMVAELAYPGTSRIAQYVYYGGVDRPFAMITGNGAIGTAVVRYYYMDPVEGNLMTVMKDTITMHQLTRYTSWGLIDQRPINVLADTNRLGWKGLMYEGDSTRLYYVRNRWYDPQAGRFTSEDPIGIAGGMNLYAYANNDPINGSDPSGLCDRGDIQETEDGSDLNVPDGERLIGTDGKMHLCHGDGLDGWWQELPAEPLPAVHTIWDGNSPLVGAGADFSAMIGAGLSGGFGVYVTSHDFGVYVRGGVGVGVDVSAGASYIGSTSKNAFTGHSNGVCGGVLAVGGCRNTNNSGTTYSFGPSIGTRDLPIPFSFHVESSYTGTLGYQDVIQYLQRFVNALP